MSSEITTTTTTSSRRPPTPHYPPPPSPIPDEGRLLASNTPIIITPSIVAGVATNTSNSAARPVSLLSSIRRMTLVTTLQEEAVMVVNDKPQQGGSSERTLNEEYEESTEIFTSSRGGAEEAPAFLSVSVMKEENSILGLKLEEGGGGVLKISAISQEGLFASSPLRVGDSLISINRVSCEGWSTRRAMRVLEKRRGRLVIVTHNPDGKADLIETMITKDSIARNCADLTTSDSNNNINIGLDWIVVEDGGGSLCISHVHPCGKMAYSMLMVGNRILSIQTNKQSLHLTNLRGADQKAKQILKDPDFSYITILAHTPLASTSSTTLFLEEMMYHRWRTADVMERRWQENQIRTFSRTATETFYACCYRHHPRRNNNNNNNSTLPILLFLGPAFSPTWNRAKVAHIVSNAIVILSTFLGLALDMEQFVTIATGVVGILVVNMPWWAWPNRDGACCSSGQAVSTILVMLWCGYLLPLSYSEDDESETSLFRSVALAVPLTIIANLPMLFVDDKNWQEYLDDDTDAETLTVMSDEELSSCFSDDDKSEHSAVSSTASFSTAREIPLGDHVGDNNNTNNTKPNDPDDDGGGFEESSAL